MTVYTRPDDEGKPRDPDAIGANPAVIAGIADRLQRRGFGVMRRRHPQSGKAHYTLKATWASPGDPPESPSDRP